MPPTTIAATASQSGVVDIGNHIQSMSLEMPTAWTTASITFLGASSELGTYKKVVGDTGTEISITAATNEMIALDSTKMDAIRPFRFLKLRSGTAASPVEQSEERTIYVMVK